MDAQYDLPNGDKIWVIDTETVGQSLARILELFASGSTEPVFFSNNLPRPEGVVISFEQWAEYEAIKTEAEFERRIEGITRERITNFRPEDGVQFEDMMREYGWEDPDDDGRTS